MAVLDYVINDILYSLKSYLNVYPVDPCLIAALKRESNNERSRIRSEKNVFGPSIWRHQSSTELEKGLGV